VNLYRVIRVDFCFDFPIGHLLYGDSRRKDEIERFIVIYAENVRKSIGRVCCFFFLIVEICTIDSKLEKKLERIIQIVYIISSCRKLKFSNPVRSELN